MVFSSDHVSNQKYGLSTSARKFIIQIKQRRNGKIILFIQWFWEMFQWQLIDSKVVIIIIIKQNLTLSNIIIVILPLQICTESQRKHASNNVPMIFILPCYCCRLLELHCFCLLFIYPIKTMTRIFCYHSVHSSRLLFIFPVNHCHIFLSLQ